MMGALATIPKYDGYIGSGYNWIGAIPSDWELTKLRACLRPVSLKSRPDLPLLSITREQGVIERDIEDQDSNHNFIPDDLSGYKVLRQGQFGMNKMKAWQGSYGVSQFTGIVSPAYFIFDFTKLIEPNFFNWAIRSKLYVSFFGSASDGVRIGQWDLSKSRMKDIPFLLPSPGEQKVIAVFLDKKSAQIDEAIAIKEKQIALLKERKQIIIQKAVTQGLTPNVPMKDSDVEWIGQIPEHWDIKKLKYMVNFAGGGTPSKDNKDYWGGDVSWVSPKDMKYDSISSSIDTITDLAVKKSSVKLIPKGAILIVVRGMILARKIPVAMAEKELTINQDMKAMLVDRDQCAPLFLRLLLDGLHEELSTLLEESGHGTKTFPTEKLAGFSLPVPPKNEQNNILKFIDRASKDILDLVLLQEQQIEKLKEYKTTLINSAVTGKIKVA